VVRAPGRVNLIGEHTDYNDGFVMPMAIDRATWIALRPREDRRVIVRTLDLGKSGEFSLDGLQRGKICWLEYLKGVAWALTDAGCELRGWEGVLTSDVPIGSGLSSSAALELATARAFSAVSGFEWDATRMDRLGQKSENQWVGVNCGIMDQLISAQGRAGHALLIDCRSLEFKAYPLPAGTSVVVMDTATRRGLEGSAYNERRSQCEAAARFFGVSALRDVSVEQFAAREGELAELTRRRARHVVSENARTLAAAEAMAAGDAEALGQLMNESHDSLRDDFEVSSKELNEMVECALGTDGCLGARMTGAGFGGCAVALVRTESAQSFMESVSGQYKRVTGLTPALYLCQATAGAEVCAAEPVRVGA
jgi:galactokinase